MSLEIIAPRGAPLDRDVVAEAAPIHEEADFDRMLIGYFSDAPTVAGRKLAI